MKDLQKKLQYTIIKSAETNNISFCTFFIYMQ